MKMFFYKNLDRLNIYPLEMYQKMLFLSDSHHKHFSNWLKTLKKTWVIVSIEIFFLQFNIKTPISFKGQLFALHYLPI